MSPAPVLTALDTARLRLRPQQPEDAAVVHQLWCERDARVPAHRRIDAAGRPNVDDIAAHIREHRDDPTMQLLTVCQQGSGDVIGYCGLLLTEHGGDGEPELAFELLRAVHNRGYATEAGRAVTEWADAAGHHRLWASVWDWNLASRRVLEKLGFRDSGRPYPQTRHGRTLLTVREHVRSGRLG